MSMIARLHYHCCSYFMLASMILTLSLCHFVCLSTWTYLQKESPPSYQAMQRSREGSLVKPQVPGQSTTNNATNNNNLLANSAMPMVTASSLESAMANTSTSSSTITKTTNSVSFYEEGNQVYPYLHPSEQDENATQSPVTQQPPRTSLRSVSGQLLAIICLVLMYRTNYMIISRIILTT